MAHNIFERAGKLTYLGDRHQFAERIDKDVLVASLAAEATIPLFRDPAWSVALAQARHLHKCLSWLQTGLSNPVGILEYRQMFPEAPFPPTLFQCSAQWRQANYNVQEIIKQSYA